MNNRGETRRRPRAHIGVLFAVLTVVGISTSAWAPRAVAAVSPPTADATAPGHEAAHQWLLQYCTSRFGQYTKLCMAAGMSPALRSAVLANEHRRHEVRPTLLTRSATIHEHSVPTRSLPIDIKNSPDGSPWFSETTNKMGRIDYQTKAVTEYQMPTEAGTPYAVNGGPGNFMWFTSLIAEQYGNKIGRIDVTTREVRLWEIPTPYSYPADLKTGPDGAIWFTETRGNKIARFDPATFKFDEFDVGIPNALPQDVAIVDGGVWYSDQAANVIQRIDPYTHKIDTFPYPTPNSAVLDIDPGRPGVEGLDVSPDTHTVWFFGMASGRVGFINTLTHEMKDFPAATPGAIPFCGGAGPDGAMYWSEPGANRIGRFDMATSQITDFPIPTPGAWPVDVTKNHGSEYNALFGANAILEIRPEAGS